MLEGLKQSAVFLDLQKQYEMLSARDRSILKASGVILMLCILYFAMWLPASEFMENAKRDVDQNTKLLQLAKQSITFSLESFIWSISFNQNINQSTARVISH